MQYHLSQVSREIVITKHRNATEDNFDAEAWFSARQTEMSLQLLESFSSDPLVMKLYTTLYRNMPIRDESIITPHEDIVLNMKHLGRG